LAEHCGCPSAEQIVQTVHSHLLFSPWYIVCVLAFHSARKIALWAYKQTVQKRANYPLLFPGELAFLFQLQAVKELESLCQYPELIALSWSSLYQPPNVQKMFINNVSSRFWVGFFCSKLCSHIQCPLFSAKVVRLTLGEGGEMKAAYGELMKASEVLSAPVLNMSARRARTVAQKSPVRTFRATAMREGR